MDKEKGRVGEDVECLLAGTLLRKQECHEPISVYAQNETKQKQSALLQGFEFMLSIMQSKQFPSECPICMYHAN